jgi:D-lactate dehydrogenase (cytochrome)
MSADPNARLVGWLEERYGADEVKSVPYRPFLGFFYPALKLPDRMRDLDRLRVVRPRSTAEVSAILAFAHEIGAPIHVRQGTGLLSLDTLLPFPPGCTVIDLGRLDLLDPQIDAGYVEVGPAITLGQTNAALEEHGFGYPVAVEQVQWGGLASINLSGHIVDAYSGKPSEQILGLTAVLADGTVLETGTTSMRKLVGPDLTRLFVGNQALFGVITQLRLRLCPRPEGRCFGWAVFDDIAGIGRTAMHMYSERVSYPAVMELVDDRFAAVSGMNDHVPAGHLLMLATEGDDEAHARRKMDALLDLAGRFGGRDRQVTTSQEEWNRIWTIRESPFRHTGDNEYLFGEALDVPVRRTCEGLDRVRPLLTSYADRFPGLRGYLVAHIGAGTLHPIYTCPPDWSYDDRLEVTRQLRAAIEDVKIELDATVGEQGIFPQHAHWFERRYGRESVDTIGAVKRALDPRGILNPTRFEPSV